MDSHQKVTLKLDKHMVVTFQRGMVHQGALFERDHLQLLFQFGDPMKTKKICIDILIKHTHSLSLRSRGVCEYTHIVSVFVCAYPWEIGTNIASVFSSFTGKQSHDSIRIILCHHCMFPMKIQVKKRIKWRGEGQERKALKQPHF